MTPLTNAALLVRLKPKTRKETFMSNNKDILFKELSYHIIGAAFKVHSALGCGFSESCYQTALALELQSLNLPFTQQERFEVYYNDQFCGFMVTDMIVGRSIILELKSAESITSGHIAQLFSYLRATKLRVGYVLNFGSKSLGFKRIIL
jgi:GxxExxY protein